MRLKYRVTKNRDCASGTSLVGFVRASVSTLIEHFGAPEYINEESPANWIVEFKDGTIATIYIHKPVEFGLGPSSVPIHDYRWHVGGTSDAAIRYVAHVLGVQPLLWGELDTDEELTEWIREYMNM